MTRFEQERSYGAGAPLGALAIAEACERLKEGNKSTLFKDADGNEFLWVRGETPDVALQSDLESGVRVCGRADSNRHIEAFASLLR